MHLCRFDDDKLGLVDGDVVCDVTEALDIVPTVRWPLPAGDPMIAQLDQLRKRIKQIAAEAPKYPLAGQDQTTNLAIQLGPVPKRRHVRSWRKETLWALAERSGFDVVDGARSQQRGAVG